MYASKINDKFNLIYRNNGKNEKISEINKFIRKCKKKHIDFFIQNDVSLISQLERLETTDEYGRVKPDTILFLNLFRSLANMEYQNRVESHRFGVQQAKELGRYKGVGGRQLESIDEFFDKPKNINILRHLKRGESIRRTAKLVGSSTGLVQKVKRWALDHNRLEL